MEYIHAQIEASVLIAWIVVAVSFAVLAKCADIFVDSSVAMATRFKVPRLVIGIVLVSLATTAPELTVSLLSALRGQPEMALGNAIGSVICDDGLALGLAGLVSAAPIAVMPRVLRSSGLFLLLIEIIAFLFIVFDQTLNRWEGMVLVTLFVGYIALLYNQHRSGRLGDEVLEADAPPELRRRPAWQILLLFALALGGIVVSSELIVTSATSIALSMGIPETIIAGTLIAFGTSIPEVATCVVAARKKEGAIAVGNIIGADIMNICWVAGASAIANDLTVKPKSIWFMFPSMFVIVGAMLLMLRAGYTLTRKKGMVLFGMYVAYLVTSMIVFPKA